MSRRFGVPHASKKQAPWGHPREGLDMSETRCSIRFQSTPASSNARRTAYQTVTLTLSETPPQRQGEKVVSVDGTCAPHSDSCLPRSGARLTFGTWPMPRWSSKAGSWRRSIEWPGSLGALFGGGVRLARRGASNARLPGDLFCGRAGRARGENCGDRVGCVGGHPGLSRGRAGRRKDAQSRAAVLYHEKYQTEIGAEISENVSPPQEMASLIRPA